MPAPFLKLEDLLLAPPLAAALGALMAMGLAAMGLVVARRLRGPAFEPLDGAAGITLVLGLTGGAVHALALAQALSLWPLRLAAWGIAAVGVVACAVARNKLVALSREARVWWLALCGPERTLAAVLAAAAVFLILAALGPACDADSLNYHLAVPLDWLRHGGAYPRPDWYHARLVGLGESINLLGLAGGTDCLGACLQALGGVLAAVAVTAFCRSDRDRLIAVGLVVGCPLLISLVPCEKFQVLPAAATTAALVVTVKRWGALDRSTLLLACTAVAFAAGCKHSFLLSAPVVLVSILISAARSRELAFSLACAAATMVLLAVPIYARNLAFYGDPISPFLERWRQHPDPSLLGFADYSRFFAGPTGLRGLASFALHAVAWRPVTGALGVGVLFLPFVPRRDSNARRLLAAAGMAALLSIGLSRLAPRYFLEPYLWSVAALGAGTVRSAGKWLTAAVAGQAALVATGAAFAAGLVFPGSFSRSWRARRMAVMARGQLVANWLDEVLAPGDVVFTEEPAYALMPRPFATAESFDGSLAPEAEHARLKELIQGRGITVMVVEVGEDLLPSIAELARSAKPIGPPRTFREPIPDHWIDSSTRQLQLLRLREPRPVNRDGRPPP